MTFDRRQLLLSTLLAAVPISRQAALAAPVNPDYWPTREWQTALPSSQGVEIGKLADADKLIRSSMPDVTGLLIVRNGFIVHEAYFGGEYGRADSVQVFSITKSVMSVLIGVALSEGAISSLDETLGDLIPDWIPANADSRTADVTISNLLTMTAGWDWDEDAEFDQLVASNDWLAFALSKTVTADPGSTFNYNSASSHVLSAVLTRATGEDTADFAQRVLFTPVGIARPAWERAPEDLACGGFGLEMTPRNLAKVGLLMLAQGRWDNERIVPSDYIRTSTDEQNKGGAPGYGAYGYLWWLATPSGLPSYFAMGYGEQYLYVVPDRQLVIVVVKGYRDEPALFTPPRPMIETMLIPAAEAGTPVG